MCTICPQFLQMGLKGNSMDSHAKTKTEYDNWLSNPEHLSAVRARLDDPDLTDEQVGLWPHNRTYWSTSWP